MLYHLVYLIASSYPQEKINQISDQIDKLIQDHQGEIIKKVNLGEKHLAYPIQGVANGYYTSNFIKLEVEQVKSLEKKLKEQGEILRFLITKWSGEVPGDKKEKALEETKDISKSQTDLNTNTPEQPEPIAETTEATEIVLDEDSPSQDNKPVKKNNKKEDKKNLDDTPLDELLDI
ncbi:MAG: 30S ribosomal protein S6 [Patescibacteria group bacterium]|nr:30S ribosomal protein S6 [Patescibacteria group bacterium]